MRQVDLMGFFMAAFKILTRENDALRDGNAVAHDSATAEIQQRPAGMRMFADMDQPLDADVLDDDPLPRVVLRLPDVAAPALAHGRSRFATVSLAYWLTIVVGSLLAVWLVASARKPASHSTGEPAPWASEIPAPAASAAPAWSPSAGDPLSQPPRWRANDTDGETRPSAAVMPATTVPSPLRPAVKTHPPTVESNNPVEHMAPAAPAGSTTLAQPRAEVRTAHSGQTRWDGRVPRPAPSEAVPLGITTPVP